MSDATDADFWKQKHKKGLENLLAILQADTSPATIEALKALIQRSLDADFGKQEKQSQPHPALSQETLT